MGAENHDIVARVGRSAIGSTSTGALAAHLAGACGHVLVDARVIRQGYRFHTELGDEIPAFFNKRMSTGSTNVAVTLQAGFDPDAHAPSTLGGHQGSWATDPFDGCRSTADAQAVVEAEDYHASMWLAKLTIAFDLYEVTDIADPIFIAKHPNEFRMISEELIALGLMQGHACPVCSDEDRD